MRRPSFDGGVRGAAGDEDFLVVAVTAETARQRGDVHPAADDMAPQEPAEPLLVGKLLVGGSHYDVRIAQYNPGGTPDTSFADNGSIHTVGVGIALAAATVESAKANPELDYVLIDDAADTDFDGKKDADNVKPLLYNTAEAAFLAGYASADFSKTGKVGTYGGQPFPTVTIFMDGFKQGAEYYAEENGKDVEVVGWDGKNGSFTGGFEANEAATSTARRIIDQDADHHAEVGQQGQSGAVAPRVTGGLGRVASPGREPPREDQQPADRGQPPEGDGRDPDQRSADEGVLGEEEHAEPQDEGDDPVRIVEADVELVKRIEPRGVGRLRERVLRGVEIVKRADGQRRGIARD